MPLATAAGVASRLPGDAMTSPLATLGLGLGLGTWLIVAYRRTSGTTLRAAVVWATIALAAVLAVEMGVAQSASARDAAWRYLAAVSTFCPSMALLGAKRPQDRGWQFVVATLWLVLALPALQAMVFAPGGRLDLHPAWRWFLMLLIVVAVSNYLPTRSAVPALLAGAAQCLLLRDQTPIPWGGTDAGAVRAACGALLIAMTLVGCGWPRPAPTANPANRVWRDFRDAFGAVWALRVMERINHAARQASRTERLDWQGFTESWNPLQESSDTADPLQLTIRMLLRRFVSAEWILRHQQVVPERHA